MSYSYYSNSCLFEHVEDPVLYHSILWFVVMFRFPVSKINISIVFYVKTIDEKGRFVIFVISLFQEQCSSIPVCEIYRSADKLMWRVTWYFGNFVKNSLVRVLIMTQKSLIISWPVGLNFHPWGLLYLVQSCSWKSCMYYIECKGFGRGIIVLYCLEMNWACRLVRKTIKI